EVTRIGEGEILRLAETAVGLHAGDEVLTAEPARRAARQPAQWTRDGDAVAELEAFVLREIFFDDEVLGHVPAADRARESQLGLELADVLPAQLVDRLVRNRAAADDFLLDPAGLVDVLELDVNHRIDRAFGLERPEPVLPPPAGEGRPLFVRRDAFQVQLR